MRGPPRVSCVTATTTVNAQIKAGSQIMLGLKQEHENNSAYFIIKVKKWLMQTQHFLQRFHNENLLGDRFCPMGHWKAYIVKK